MGRSPRIQLVIAILALAAIVVFGFPLAVYVFAFFNFTPAFLTIAVIGLLGGLGGTLSAAQSGSLTFPKFQGEEVGLGMLREVFFGSVGAFVIFLFIPGISEHALDLSAIAVREADEALANLGNWDKPPKEDENRESPKANDGARDATGQGAAKTTELSAPPANDANGTSGDEGRQEGGLPNDDEQAAPQAKEPDLNVDWLELFALALIGGYAGRSIIEKALMQYVTEQQLGEVKQKVDNDTTAVKYFHDQIDIFTPSPPAMEMKSAIKQASGATRGQIYVHTRSRCGLYMLLASQISDLEKRKRLKRQVAERVIPLMEALIEADRGQQYRGSRYLLAVSYYIRGDLSTARNWIDEAISISRRDNRAVPAQYAALRNRIENNQLCDEQFLEELVSLNARN